MAGTLSDALVRKISVSNRLDHADIEALRTLPIQRREVRAREIIVRDGQRATQCCLVAEGFVFRSKSTPDGQRQILSLHIPGEIPDLQSLHLGIMDHDLIALTSCTLGFIPHDILKRMNATFPNIAAALWRETLIDASIFREWILNVGRRTGVQRMAHLLSEMRRRLEVVSATHRDQERVNSSPLRGEDKTPVSCLLSVTHLKPAASSRLSRRRR